ncbi:unnamed protein product, partial [Ectocarpus sp. 13 AM-2016]
VSVWGICTCKRALHTTAVTERRTRCAKHRHDRVFSSFPSTSATRPVAQAHQHARTTEAHQATTQHHRSAEQQQQQQVVPAPLPSRLRSLGSSSKQSPLPAPLAPNPPYRSLPVF